MMKTESGESVCSRTGRLVAEFEQSRDPDSTEIGRQFSQLQRTMMERKDASTCLEGAKLINRFKNRYKDVLPYDHCRVVLQSDNDSDYINASFIENLDGHRRYIAAQGPIDESLIDFFRMIWDFQVTSIICTANDVEAGRFKFRRYWPDDEDSFQFGSYRISKDPSIDKCYGCADYEIRPLIITQENTERHVLLYHILHWPDHDTPNDEGPILDLLLRLDQDRDCSIDSPILVHCSAGCGRTGSLIAIDLCRSLLNNEHLFLTKDYQPYPVFKIASHIRQFRVALIQTLRQYFFVYKLFAFMMKTNGNDVPCLITNNDENQTLDPSLTAKSSSRRPSVPLQITLRNPPIGRRLLTGNHNSNVSSPTMSPSEFFPSLSLHDTPQTPEPPSISVRYATSKHREEQYNHSDAPAVNTDRHHRTFRRTSSTKSRSDSADAVSYQHRTSNEQEVNSD